MKDTMKLFFGAIVAITILSSFVAITVPKEKMINIKTSAICGTCKNIIEKALKSTNGVSEALLNIKSKEVKVKYNPDLLSADQVRLVIINSGYNADEHPRNAEAYSALPECCKGRGAKHD
jgi:mercuric ion binding protein